MEPRRQPEFQRNEDLELLLAEVNRLLGPLEEEFIKGFRDPRYPVVLVIGAPRCGSTLVTQWLAHSGKFAYPTNLLSRFFGAPAIGAKIQQLLTDPRYSFKDEILDFHQQMSFESSLGKTKGALAPNEFWYFWRRFVPNTELRYLEPEELEEVQSDKLLAELAALEAVFDKPLALKGMILQLNIRFFSDLFKKVLFLFVERHPFYNIQSLLESRVRFFGNRRSWYSVMPKEYSWLKDLDPVSQVAGQVYFTTSAIREGLEQIDESRYLRIEYESFCAAPQDVFQSIADKLFQQGYKGEFEYVGPQRFKHTNHIRLPVEDRDRILERFAHFSGHSLTI